MTKKQIIIVNGVARSGKDTFVDNLKNAMPNRHIFGISSIEDVKRAIVHLRPVNSSKNDKYRKFLSDVKDAWTEYCDGPFKSMVARIQNFKIAFSNCIITVMVREPDEIKKLKNYFGDECVTVLVQRDTDHIPDNHADALVNNYNYDYYIGNNLTLDAFKASTKTFIEKVLL